jgi:hypothetical protein
MTFTHITPHFTWQELIVSSSFPEIAEKIQLTERDKYNYYHLIATTLEPERTISKICTSVVQGKRNQELFDALVKIGLNPSSTSQHFCTGFFACAIDFQKLVTFNSVPNIDKSRVATHAAFEWIRQNCPYGFGQMYYTKPTKPEQIGFIHIGSVTPKLQGESWIK